MEQVISGGLLVLKLLGLYFFMVALFALKKPRPIARVKPKTRFACLVAARNEERVIAELVESLKRQDYPAELFDIYVMPNNCTDHTALAAIRAGAQILRPSGEIHCKGDALHEAFERLLSQDYDAFCVFDADNFVDPVFLSRMNDAFQAGAKAAKGALRVKNPEDGPLCGCYGLYFTCFDFFFSRARMNCGLSSKLVGTGFAVHRSVLEASGREEIIGSKGAAVFGSHAYFYGNSEKPNEVYSCRISNPLYFPSASKTEIGSVDQPVVAAAHQNGKLVAFKQSEIYKINLAAGNTVSRAISENYDKDTFIIGDSLSSESISMKIGTTFGKTVAECAGQLIWLGSDGNVYTLEATTYGSEKNIFELSYPISSEIKKALAENATGKEPFAVSTGGYYYLFINDAVFVCDCRINNFGYAKRYAAENIGSAGWYIWKTPSLNITGAQICEEPVFCGKTDGNIDYLSSLSESVADTIPETDENGAVAEKRLPVKSSFTTAFYKFGTDGYKIPESIYFYSTGGILNAGCKTDKREYKKHIHNGKGEIILLPRSALGRVKRAAFFAESGSGMEISDIRFKYRTE